MAVTIRSRIIPSALQKNSMFQQPFYHPRSFLCSNPSIWRLLSSGFASKPTASNFNSAPRYFQYKYIEDVERIENYQPGGYHPVFIGDIFQKRYRVVHKLGYGTFSTIWLCRDDQSNEYVAVKVGIAELKNFQEADFLGSLKYTFSLDFDHLGNATIPLAQDRFVVEGPNGGHPCYVTAPARCSVSDAKEASYKYLFHASTARSLIVQLVQAVQYIHARGIVHGDLHLGNVILQLPPGFDQLSIEQLYKRYGAPGSEPVVRLDGQPLSPGVPSTVILPIWLGKQSEKFSPPEAQIFLIDFGEAYSPSSECRNYSHSPVGLAPPECRFQPEQSLSFPSDIWTLACAIWAILGQRPLFSNCFATQDDITAEQVEVLGNLPLGWWEKWEARDQYYYETGEPNQARRLISLEDRFETDIKGPRQKTGVPGFDDKEDNAAIMDMMRSMLTFRPERRLTAQGVMKCEWMVKWGLPEFEKFSLRNDIYGELRSGALMAPLVSAMSTGALF